MNKTYHFLAGLPRSGNTLLSAILNQNPNIYSTPLSPMPSLMWDYVNSCSNTEQINRNEENETRAKELLSSFFDTFYKSIDKPVVIDREKDWGTPANLDLIKRFVSVTWIRIFKVRTRLIKRV
jgi:sulfotransferase